LEDHPATLRGLFYRVVSAGWLPSTDKEHYRRLGRLMTSLRKAGIVPFAWIVDNVRSTLKPPSWSGLADFAETTRKVYRLDFWARLPHYVHVIVEKDAMAGVLEPVTKNFDVALSPIRGYSSWSFAGEIAETWNGIKKPITVYYLGDFDPSGFDLERDTREKLGELVRRPFDWQRLAVKSEDFETHNLIVLEPKKLDTRSRKFVATHGERCAELDAIPANDLRRRVQEAIEQHIPGGEWEQLQMIERNERDLWDQTLGQL
jgi:hypothetical protein